MQKEKWLSVVGYEGLYEVSDHGQVRSVDREVVFSNGRVYQYPSHVLSPFIDKDGYRRVQLSSSGKTRKFFVHRLVLSAFTPTDGWETLQVRHGDDTPSNNHLSNLCWGTGQDNSNDCVERGRSPRGEKNARAKVTADDILNIRHMFSIGFSQATITAFFGLSKAHVYQIVNGNKWQHI